MTDLTPYRGKRALVCGGRDYKDGMTVSRVLDSLDPSMVIEGGARGADWMAALWWMEKSILKHETYEADWRKHGRRAGPIRNARMLAEGRPDYVLAFPGGRGTEDMVAKAKAAGVPVLRVRRDGGVEVDNG